ncbi:helix-turn-helix domain-containing protein [Thalassospira sp. MA62]|nr:helix-turn-helix domain-containing protein [Thalassospira sp. MA62]
MQDKARKSTARRAHDTGECLHTRFSVENLPEQERYEAWKNSINCIFDVDADFRTRNHGFNSSIESFLLGSVMLSDVISPSQSWSRTRDLIARDGMDHYAVEIYELGDLRCDQGQGGDELEKGGVLVFDLSQTFTAQSSNMRNVTLLIPRAHVEEQLLAPDAHKLRFLSPKDPMVRILRDQMVSLHRNIRDLTVNQAQIIEQNIIATLVCCLNTASGDSPQTTAARRDMVKSVAIRRYFRKHLFSAGLNPDQAAKDLGISRSKLYQMYENYGGVQNYIRNQRLQRAANLINNPVNRHRSIYDIALECGFASDNSFIRAFRNRFGATPGQIRQGLVDPKDAQDISDNPQDKRYEFWMHNLS